MLHNLAAPFADACSPPQSPYLAFHSPQADDLLFAGPGPIAITCQTGLRAVGLRWSLHRNMIAKPFRSGRAEALLANRFRIAVDPAGLHPGFYDLRVELDSGTPAGGERLAQRPVHGVCTFGWRAADMAIARSRPAGFAAFWAAAIASLRAIPHDARLGPMQSFDAAAIAAYNAASACLPPDPDPEGCRTATVESCAVSLAGPAGGRIHGWLAKPPGPGPFPAMLVLPGAGFAARPRPLEHARHGYLALDIQIHGQEADLPRYPAIPGYHDGQVHEPVEAHYFYDVHRRCLQALDWLASRPDVDPRRIVVVGGSQGGRLAIVLAGLDRRIAAAVPAIANSPDVPWLRWVARTNGLSDLGGRPDPALLPGDGMDLAGAPPVIDDARGRCLAHYDPVNFAEDIRCPVLFNAGLIDPVSPPSSVFAAFNRVPGPDKTMLALDGLGHDWCAEFDRRAYRWLDRVLAR